jgi:hypothetical protein
MSKVFCFKISEHSTGTTSEIPVEIPEDEWQMLMDFAEGSKSLADTEFVRKGMPIHYEIDSVGTLVARNSSPLPLPSVMHEFLHAMRPFILSGEPWCYERVTGILRRRLDHPLWRNLIKGYVRSFRADDSQKSFTVRAGGFVLNSEKALDLWLNGYEYHRDADKRAQLEATKTSVSWELSQALFLDILAAQAEAIFELADIVRFLEDGLALVESSPSTGRTPGTAT